MPKITYIEHDGAVHEIEVAPGLSVMQGAIQNDIEGIEAECGGNCMCATCHVYVEEAFLERLPAPDATEMEMLECTAAPRQRNSRLSCQLQVSSALEGLVVRLPEIQG